jgi:DNA-binding transcriptional regulator YdaS (Cro superfamily)
MSVNSLTRAIGILGSQTALARACGKRQGHVWWWLNRSMQVPAEHVLTIERATNGKVTRSDLRPDIYPVDLPAPPRTPDALSAAVTL